VAPRASGGVALDGGSFRPMAEPTPEDVERASTRWRMPS
jgi:hypothetical protein